MQFKQNKGITFSLDKYNRLVLCLEIIQSSAYVDITLSLDNDENAVLQTEAEWSSIRTSLQGRNLHFLLTKRLCASIDE